MATVTLAIALLLPSCGNEKAVPPNSQETTTATPLPEVTSADSINHSPAESGFVNLTRNNTTVLGCGGVDGYYETYAADNGGVNVVYIDYATAQEMYLCASPNCTHDSEACNTWIPPEEAGLFPLVSGEHLLLIHRTYGGEEGVQAIPRIDHMNLDGSDRKTLIEFDANEYIKDVFAANGNTLICALNSVESSTSPEATFRLVEIDLNTGARTDFYEQSVQVGMEPIFMGVTDSGYCILSQFTETKSPSDFPDQEWNEISAEIARSRVYTWTAIPVGYNEAEQFFTYNGRIENYLAADGLYIYDQDAREVLHVSVPDAQQTHIATLPDENATSAYIDGRMDEWLLLSVRRYEQVENIEYNVAVDVCYAVNTETGEIVKLDITQQVAADQRMALMLAQTDSEILLVTDSETSNYPHYGMEYSVIGKEDYLHSNASALRRVQFIENS